MRYVKITKGRENIPLVALAKLKQGNFKQHFNMWNSTCQRKLRDNIEMYLEVI